MQPTSSKLFNSLLFQSNKNKLKLKKKIHKKRNKIPPQVVDDDDHHQTIQNPNTVSPSAELVGTNDDLMNIILSKLRKKRRFAHTIVCKTWYKVITGRPFKMKLPPPCDLVIQRYTRIPRQIPYPSTKYLTVKLDSEKPLPELHEPFLHFLEANNLHSIGIRISQSCNGLFLCPASSSLTIKKRKKHNLSTPHETNSANVKHYVYNPTTNKTRLIPLPSNDHKRHVTTMSLAFDPSDSNQPHYKIVSFSNVDEKFFAYTQVDIYSSETHSWSTSRAKFPQNCAHVDFSKGVFLNGSIHWPSYTPDTSIYFNVEDQYFNSMPMPPVQEGQTRRKICFFGESGGRLLLIDFHEPSPMQFDVFNLETDYSGWSVKHHVDFTNGSFRFRALSSWIIKFHVLSVICGADEDDLSLVMYVPGRDKAGKGLIIYNLKKKKIKKVHSPVTGWDLKLLEEKGSAIVHPFIRTRFEV